jgi:hypothetical protein
MLLHVYSGELFVTGILLQVYSGELLIADYAVAGVQWRSIILTGHDVAGICWSAVYNWLCCCKCISMESCL